MNALVKKIHMYLGLLNFTALLIFGVAGLMITFSSSPEERKRPQPEAQFRDFNVPPNVDDESLGRMVHLVLDLPLTRPVPRWAIRRDREQNLTFDFYTVNGLTRAVVLEKENRIRLEPTRNGFWQYLNNMHATTARAPDQDKRVRLWAYYIEMSIWAAA